MGERIKVWFRDSGNLLVFFVFLFAFTSLGVGAFLTYRRTEKGKECTVALTKLYRAKVEQNPRDKVVLEQEKEFIDKFYCRK